ncbi:MULTISPECIES: DUF5064 family protein [Pseudomonas]|uniref:DUF5064 domain-containing protein n=1 Tax=Pseudomonas frederiksbergensis TaxID=104087 RepID=A0A2S8HCE4_9PSED|nr:MULTISPECIES: DUF5064 family protein [Pseudomonas]PQP00149.1 DUF5064 domain-containing protein [Pseudomonas frederiksbergensis]WLG43785.1 DUF5064 family protein [Pseudomonas sp. FP1740]WLG49662.1 DUF5064 family protein [Pseudomonas sp. FP1742]
MATFEPGHLHIERHALNKDDYSYNLHIEYKIAQDPKEGQGMLFTLRGSVEGKELKNEEFYLPKDQAFDFARHATRIAQKYGLPKTASIGAMHKYYDEMFENVRAQLDVKSGDPVKPEHLG